MNCCTIDWFNEWPAEALQSVASSFLDEIPLLGSGNEDTKGMVGAPLENTLLLYVQCSGYTKTMEAGHTFRSVLPCSTNVPWQDHSMQNCIAFVCLEMGLAICHPSVALKPTHTHINSAVTV